MTQQNFKVQIFYPRLFVKINYFQVFLYLLELVAAIFKEFVLEYNFSVLIQNWILV
jgi:hypothetical protein